LIVEKKITGNDLLGWEHFKQYFNAIVDIHARSHQRDVLGMSTPDLLPEMIRKNKDVKKLINSVKSQKVRVTREAFAKRLDAGALPFEVLVKLPQIEEEMWKLNSHSGPYAVSGLRDLFFLLFTKACLVRGESLCHAELSDLLSMAEQYEGPIGHDALIFILQIYKGKQIIDGCIVWGRSMRHADVSLCSIGALAFYLVMRFHITKETICITDNKSWFNRKLLIRPTKGAGLNQEMVYSHYGKVLEKIGRQLEIEMAEFKHFGRFYGQMDGDLKDMDEKDLDHFGNWNSDSCKKHYSLNIPFHGIRQLAGHPKLCGLTYWTRSVCDTSNLLENGKPLQQTIFPFLEKMKADLRTTRDQDIHHTTAAGFVGLLKNLHCMFLQDASVMILQGCNHVVLELPYAKTRAFYKLLKCMQFTLEDEIDKKINAPSLADSVSEEMNAQLNNFHHTLSHGLGVVKKCMKEWNDKTKTNFHTAEGAIDALVTNDDMQEISSEISTITEKHIGATLSSPTKKKKKTTPVVTASPYNTAHPTEVACITPFSPMLEPTVTELHMAAASSTITAHIPQPTRVSGSNIPGQELLRRPTLISDDYDEAVDFFGMLGTRMASI
jgi:hypothetical protein